MILRSTFVTTAAGLALAALAGCGGTDRATGTSGSTAAATSPPTSTSASTPTTTGPATTIDAPDTTPGPAPTTPSSVLPPPVFEFTTPAPADGWQVINDTVMGGGVRE